MTIQELINICINNKAFHESIISWTHSIWILNKEGELFLNFNDNYSEFTKLFFKTDDCNFLKFQKNYDKYDKNNDLRQIIKNYKFLVSEVYLKQKDVESKLNKIKFSNENLKHKINLVELINNKNFFQKNSELYDDLQKMLIFKNNINYISNNWGTDFSNIDKLDVRKNFIEAELNLNMLSQFCKKFKIFVELDEKKNIIYKFSKNSKYTEPIIYKKLLSKLNIQPNYLYHLDNYKNILRIKNLPLADFFPKYKYLTNLINESNLPQKYKNLLVKHKYFLGKFSDSLENGNYNQLKFLLTKNFYHNKTIFSHGSELYKLLSLEVKSQQNSNINLVFEYLVGYICMYNYNLFLTYYNIDEGDRLDILNKFVLLCKETNVNNDSLNKLKVLNFLNNVGPMKLTNVIFYVQNYLNENNEILELSKQIINKKAINTSKLFGKFLFIKNNMNYDYNKYCDTQKYVNEINNLYKHNNNGIFYIIDNLSHSFSNSNSTEPYDNNLNTTTASDSNLNYTTASDNNLNLITLTNNWFDKASKKILKNSNNFDLFDNMENINNDRKKNYNKSNYHNNNHNKLSYYADNNSTLQQKNEFSNKFKFYNKSEIFKNDNPLNNSNKNEVLNRQSLSNKNIELNNNHFSDKNSKKK